MATNVVGVWSGTTEPTAQLAVGQIWVDLSGSVPVIKALVGINPSVWRMVSTTYRGSWDQTREYIPQDVVDYGNATYVCIATNTNVIPTTDLSKWLVFAWKGPYASNTSTSSIDGVNVDGLLGMPLTGSVIAYAQFGFPNPPGWLWCDGTQYSNTQFPALATKIGRAFSNTTDPTGTFRVPSLPPLKPAKGITIAYIIKT